VAVVGVGVEQGILLAIALSLFRHVNHSYRPHTVILVPGPTGTWQPTPVEAGKETEPGLIVYRFGADLFYANYKRFIGDVRTLLDHAPSQTRWFVVEASAITDIDFTAARAVRGLLSEVSARNIVVLFARVSSYLHEDMERHGIVATAGAGRVFTTLHEALAVVRQGSGSAS
jgi:sulfate permease, SulP family